MTPAGDRATRFARFTGCRRIWAIASIHAELRRLEAIHDALLDRLKPFDGLVYLGNMIGRGAALYETIAELLTFRRSFIARTHALASDLVFLRGSQEEMWQKLLELQFAPNPAEVLIWMLDHGAGATLAAYGADPKHGLAACRSGPIAITRWTTAIRATINTAPGHASLLTALRRAAFTDNSELLFVHAGLDPSRPLTTQNDSFWWGGSGFLDLVEPYAGFTKVVRGFDKHHGGLQVAAHAISIDRGCGFGGPLAAACIAPDGSIQDSFEA
jgi:serine/threonine protein phosphatase 1